MTNLLGMEIGMTVNLICLEITKLENQDKVKILKFIYNCKENINNT